MEHEPIEAEQALSEHGNSDRAGSGRTVPGPKGLQPPPCRSFSHQREQTGSPALSHNVTYLVRRYRVGPCPQRKVMPATLVLS